MSPTEPAPGAASALRPTEALWASVGDLFREILAHPFLQGLTSGELPREAFRTYVHQDARYLHHFGRTIAALAANSPLPDDLLVLTRHAQNTVIVERALHEGFLAELGSSEAPAFPGTELYVSFQRRLAESRPFAEGLAAIYPCYKVYLEVGRALVPQGSPDPLYQRWIDTYAGDAFAKDVAELEAIMDRELVAASERTRAHAAAHVRRGTQLEWMFWDQALRGAGWPL